MQYIITFLEGFISFISPCMLPLLPLYISYFAGAEANAADGRSRVFIRAVSFVIGFTAVFSLMGLFAGTIGAFLSKYQTAVNIVSGLIVVIFGLSYLEVIRIPLFKGMQRGRTADSIVSAFLFGVIYSVSLTPCIGAFLGSALMLASASGTAAQGVLLLVAYSLGLGVPFLLSALLIEKLGGAFRFIKKHYKTINLVCGIFLIIIGIAMMFGLMSAVIAVFS